jgi:glutamyl-tRNA synthetase
VLDYDADAVAKQWKDRPATATVLRGVRDTLASLTVWEAAAMEDALRTIAEQLGFAEKAGKIFQPLRVALTGQGASPGIFEVLMLLGRERSLARIDAALVLLEAPPV